MGAVESIWLVLKTNLQAVGVGDVADIIIIAYLIYKILTVVRRTSASGIVKGIVLLLAVLWLSSVLHLNVINYLLAQTMKMGVIVLIILFQPELRKLLEQFGSRNLSFLTGQRAKSGGIEQAIETVADACYDMARAKTGALIVFERMTGLNDYAVSGTPLGAELSPELLKNIFYPNTPLHDGAVLLRAGRVIAAGCMLPMSTNTSLSKDLGMRHRAGIGVTERSDAISVVVSEETGAVSVAVDGMLKRHLSR
ncbi:MAG: diadenylate cyclase CdaA, partial [Oscillospiraceae bacterium]|nr:diadenylate cyclase CdaA [Oscillospiraceae bacterium]